MPCIKAFCNFSLGLLFTSKPRNNVNVCGHERNYGNFSVIPFFFPLESHYYLLLLRQIL